jgi:hypothetical protein
MKMMKMLKLSCAAVIAMAPGADGARNHVEDKIDNCERYMVIAQGPGLRK